jgi:uncharacterized integral membrane protein
MRTVVWLLLLIVTVFLAITLTLTFMQPAFGQEVSVSILFFKTRVFPVYFYVLAAFVAGLVLGIFPMLFLYIKTKREAMRSVKRNRELEGMLEYDEKKRAEEEAVSKFAASGEQGRPKDRN